MAESAPRAAGPMTIHWLLASAIFIALLSGFVTFNWSWRVPFSLRECLFAVHRLTGFFAGICALVWFARFRFPQSRLPVADRRDIWIRAFQFALVAMATVLTGVAWIGRALDGRWIELISPLPAYNFVSRPDTPLAHALMSVHGTLAYVMLAGLLIHAGSAGIHKLWDNLAKSPKNS